MPVAIGFGPPLIFFVAVAFLDGMWPHGIGGSVVVLMAALACIWWSKGPVVIDTDGIHWPLKFRELRWDEVVTSKMVRVFGMEYGRVETKNGKVRWIALNHVGGQEFRARVLARLGLS
jgi:hypothetical protein